MTKGYTILIYSTRCPDTPICCPDVADLLSGCFRNQCPDASEICTKTRGYDPSNVTDNVLIKEHPWAVDYPYYVEMYDIETVDTEIKNCIFLNDLIAEVGYKLYPSTEGDPSTPIPRLKIRHHQKAYIAITPYSANRIHTMLESLFKKYGKATF